MNEVYQNIIKTFKDTDVENPIRYELIKDALKAKASDTHKGKNGILTVCAGSIGLTGAAYLACTAAIKSGCGLVTLCCAESLNDIFEIKLTEVMTKCVKSKNGVISKQAFSDIKEKLDKSDAFLYGPGLSQNKNITKLTVKILKTSDKPMVIDADGLNAIAKNTDVLKITKSPLILTPHIGEFARLTGHKTDYILENQKTLALEFAKEYGVILVLKSHKTVVSDGEKVYENLLGNPGMAKGGTGDVLSGIIASFLAQGNSPMLSALAGVYIHSLAADMAVFETGQYSLLPSDIISYISHALKYSEKC